jgi:hypothetical protein
MPFSDCCSATCRNELKQGAGMDDHCWSTPSSCNCKCVRSSTVQPSYIVVKMIFLFLSFKGIVFAILSVAPNILHFDSFEKKLRLNP